MLQLLQVLLVLLAVSGGAAFTLRPVHSRRNYGTVLKSTTEEENKPSWAGDDLLSGVVNSLIGFKPLFGMMKVGARSTLIKTAEKNGIPWRGRAAELTEIIEPTLDYLKRKIEDSRVVYPSYYNQEFHAYDEGNTNWPAAVECESATMSMALRVWPKESLTASEAQDRLRYSFLNALQNYMQTRKIAPPAKILDVACSVGMSTFYLARFFQDASEILGLDLSPHFLAVAQHRQKTSTESGDKLERINWLHASMEKSGLANDVFDVTCSSFMFHELPQADSREILREMCRVTKPGGIVAITDNNPKSEVIKNLPPVLFTLMKSTEPWTDEYYTFSLETALREAGFRDVETVETDPRHRTLLATKA